VRRKEQTISGGEMLLKYLTIGAVVAVCTFVAQAAAQKNELSGIIGRSFISDQSIQGAPGYDPDLRFGNGLTFEINYSRRVVGKDSTFLSLALEVPVIVNLDEDLHAAQNVIPKQYSSYFVTPSARLSVFSNQAVSFWGSLGGGLAHFNESSTLEFGGFHNPGKTGTYTGGLQGGFGLDVRLFRKFSFRGEARDVLSGVPQLNVNTGKSHQNNIFAGGGVVWHF
jgi:hypothetical protein